MFCLSTGLAFSLTVRWVAMSEVASDKETSQWNGSQQGQAQGRLGTNEHWYLQRFNVLTRAKVAAFICGSSRVEGSRRIQCQPPQTNQPLQVDQLTTVNNNAHTNSPRFGAFLLSQKCIVPVLTALNEGSRPVSWIVMEICKNTNHALRTTQIPSSRGKIVHLTYGNYSHNCSNESQIQGSSSSLTYAGQVNREKITTPVTKKKSLTMQITS